MTTSKATMRANIIAGMAEAEFVMGLCNCTKCSRERLMKVFAESYKQIYPALPFLPRKYDGNVGYGGHDVPWRHNRASFDVILKALDVLRKENKKRRDHLATSGVRHRSFCYECGALYARHQGMQYRFKLPTGVVVGNVCPECQQKFYFQCDHCNTWKPRNQAQKIITDHKVQVIANNGDRRVKPSEYRTVCSQCFNHHYYRCHNCGMYLNKKSAWHDIGDMIGRPAHLRGSVSRRLDEWLDGHDEVSLDDVLIEDNEEEGLIPGAVLCPHCYAENVTRCPVCGDVMLRFNAFPSRNHEAVCIQCHEDERLIHSHNYHPSKIRFKASKLQKDKHTPDVLHYGIELEVEDMGIMQPNGKYQHLMDREQMAQRALQFMGKEDVYIVHDGSLTASPMGGIEIVSHPMTWEYYRENADRWTELLMKLREWGGQAYRPGTAGWHVHMSKGAFTSWQLYKFIKFFYQKSSHNFVVSICQRNGHERYARWHSSDSSKVALTAKRKHNASNDRYSAVNLTNPNTVELRMFRGTLEPLWFHKNMEFCHALFEYSKAVKPLDMVPSKFVEYIVKHRGRFKCLHEFIKWNQPIARYYPSIPQIIKKGVR